MGVLAADTDGRERMSEIQLIGENFSMGGVSVISRYDRKGQFGYLNADIDAGASLDQRRSVAFLIRQFADELEGEKE